MPGVASLLRDRPQRVHWLSAIVVACWLVGASIGFAQDEESSLPPEKPLKSRDQLLIPESLDESKSSLVIDPDAEISVDEFLNEPVVDVIIEGRETIAEHAIQHYVKVKTGRSVTPREVQEDVTALRRTHWFSSVRPIYRRTAKGLVLVYEVRERPIIRSVTFLGNKKVKTAELEAHTGLRVNQPFDVNLNREAVARIRSLYLEKGHRNADVQMTKGGDPNDREVVITITEGPKTRVHWRNFEGNTFVSDAVLRTKLASKAAFLWKFGGIYDPQIVENDVITLTQYYNNLGFFDVKVTQRVVIDDDKQGASLTFTIDEGQRYQIRNVELIGHDVLSKEQLHRRPKLKAGDPFNYNYMQKDVAVMKDQYDELGRLYATIAPTPIFLEEPGMIDLEYRINEDKPYLVGDIRVNFRGDQPHTREDVILNTVVRLAKPGKLANGKLIDLARRRVLSSQLWDQTDPPAFEIVPVDGVDYSLAADDPLSKVMRGQNIESELFGEPRPIDATTTGYGHSVAQTRRTAARPLPKVQPLPTVPARAREFPAQKVSSPPRSNRPTRSAKPNSVTASPPLPQSRTKAQKSYTGLYNIDPSALFRETEDPDLVIRGQSDESLVPRGQSIDRNGTPVPQDFGSGTSNSGNPYGGSTFGRNRVPPAPGFVDLDIDVTEGRTGRLMFGAGVNSNNGLVGSAVLQEDNFDILRVPRSWADITNGYAWRGAGQSFRLEAQPGTQVSRYMLSWNDPFFMRTDYNVGTSAFYFNRFYNNWTEDRTGGRLSVGKVIDQYWSGSLAFRLEDVGIRNITAGAPTDLTKVKGHNLLSTVGLTLSNDTRDNAFIPSQGHFLEGSYEQAFGHFNYPRAEISASQYFTVHERADGFGKHIIQLYGSTAWTGKDTPIFERYYAGGYSSFRGFAFRGVSPVKSGVSVGGNWMALGTAEYMVPLTASDQIRMVAFTDFGTVQENVGFQDFRVSAGFGFRLTIPAMGPAPIAFDFAWPLHDQKTDIRRMFSFYVGFTR